MRIYTTIIIEDETRNQSLIQNYLEKNFKDLHIVAICENVADAINKIKELQPDILLSDIELPDGTAFDVLAQTKQFIKSLIFITAFDQYAIKAIKYSAIDYILKPIMQEELIIAINKCKKNLEMQLKINKQIDVLIDSNNDEENVIAIPVGSDIQFVQLDKIIHLDADGNYTDIHIENNKRITVTKPISHFDQILNPKLFFRVHTSHIVNVKHIKKLSKTRGCLLLMANGNEIEVAVRRVKDFMNFMKL
jgi:two-component system LytT family response regulator